MPIFTGGHYYLIRQELHNVPLFFFFSVELEAIAANLSSKHLKEPALFSADHFVKMMKNWNKGELFVFPIAITIRDAGKCAKGGLQEIVVTFARLLSQSKLHSHQTNKVCRFMEN